MKRFLLLIAALAACSGGEPSVNASFTASSPAVPTVNWLDTVHTIDSTARVDTNWTYDTTITVTKIGTPPAPVARFTATCSPLRVCRFDGSASSVPAGVLAYSWFFGDGTGAGAEIVPSKTFRTAGVYWVRFEIVDSLKRKATAADSITVGVIAPAPPPPTDTASLTQAPAPGAASGLVYSYTDFYCGNHAGVCDSTWYRVMGARVDRLVNGSITAWKAANPRIEQVQYSLYWFVLTTTADTLGTSGVAPLDAFLVAHGYPIESAFLHRAGTAPTKASRIAWVAQDGDSAAAVNPADPGWRAYAMQRVLSLRAHGWAGAFYDVFGRGAMGKAFSSAEGDSLWYRTALTQELTAEHATGAVLLVNTASYDFAFDSICIVAAGGAHLERTNYPLGQNLAGGLNFWRWIDHLVAAGAQRLEFVSNLAWTDNVPPAVGNDVTPVGREKMAEYASYLMVKDGGAVVSFAPDNYWNQSPTTHWLAAWDTTLGAPSAPRAQLASGTDPVGQKYVVWRRAFARAIVLMRTQSATVTNFGDSSAVAVPIGVHGRLLRSDGSTVARDTVELRAGEGVVVLTP
ncbi:MAG TPA: PKD domain-containing protein [Gemmatimonadaceae bacterium]|nr:PKD domain-containing protein [Gemmatimonadaceae bacterium]